MTAIDVRRAAVAVLLGLASLSAASGCGLVNSCQDQGPQTSSITLVDANYLPYHPSVDRVRLCVTDGQCETRPVPAAHTLAPPSGTSAPPRYAYSSLEFTQALPESVTRQGSSGPPVHITLTLYAGADPVHSTEATLGPVTMNPGGAQRCHYRGYWVSAELHRDGSLGYHMLS
jgi:hypothetical protein